MYSVVIPDMEREGDGSSSSNSHGRPGVSISLFDVGKRLMDGKGI